MELFYRALKHPEGYLNSWLASGGGAWLIYNPEQKKMISFTSHWGENQEFVEKLAAQIEQIPTDSNKLNFRYPWLEHINIQADKYELDDAEYGRIWFIAFSEKISADPDKMEHWPQPEGDSGEMIYLKNENHAYVYVNQAMAGLFGVSPKCCIGKTDYDLLTPEEARDSEYWDRRVIECGKVHREERWFRNRLLYVQKMRVRFPGGWGIMGKILDTTAFLGTQNDWAQKLYKAEETAGFGLWEMYNGELLLTQGAKQLLGCGEIVELEPITNNLSTRDLYRLRAWAEKCLEEGVSFSEVIEYPLPSGEKGWLRITGTRTEVKGEYRLSGMVRNITREKNITDAIYLQALILRNIDQAVMATDINGKIIYWNKAAELLYGWKRAELIGKVARELNITTDPVEWQHPRSGMRWVKKRDNTEFLAYYYQSPILDEDGFPAGYIEISRDITLEHERQIRLEVSEKEARSLAAFYKSLVDTESIFVVKLSDTGKFIFINDLFASHFGDASVLIQKPLEEQVHVDDREVLREVMIHCQENPGVAFPVTFRLRAKDGSWRYAKWEFRSITDESRPDQEIFCTGYEITRLMDSLEKAENLLNITTNQNAKLKRFAYIVSHNIRSHATNLMALVDLMDEAHDRDEHQKYMEMLRNSLFRLDNTIRDLNQVISVSESAEIEFIRISLPKTIQSVLQSLSGLITTSGTVIEHELPEDFTFYTNPHFFESIILNLLTNAMKYKSPDRRSEIWIGAKVWDELLYIEVKDNGLGIDLEKYGDKLFGMYNTFHGNRDARGFGLYITKAHVEALGGQIFTDSVPGEGSTFTLVLPLKSGKKPE